MTKDIAFIASHSHRMGNTRTYICRSYWQILRSPYINITHCPIVLQLAVCSSWLHYNISFENTDIILQIYDAILHSILYEYQIGITHILIQYDIQLEVSNSINVGMDMKPWHTYAHGMSLQDEFYNSNWKCA